MKARGKHFYLVQMVNVVSLRDDYNSSSNFFSVITGFHERIFKRNADEDKTLEAFVRIRVTRINMSLLLR